MTRTKTENKKDLGMAYHTPHLKKVKKQGEMPKFVIHIIIMEKDSCMVVVYLTVL